MHTYKFVFKMPYVTGRARNGGAGIVAYEAAYIARANTAQEALIFLRALSTFDADIEDTAEVILYKDNIKSDEDFEL